MRISLEKPSLDDLMIDQKFLTHYGVKGMKWGVRKDHPYSIKRTNDDDIILKKGSNIHRITSNPNESKEGHAYGSFTEKDVNHYRKSVTSWITENSNDYKNVRTFDMTQKVTKDLVAPSERKKVDTFLKLLNNKDFNKEIRDVFTIHIDEGGDNKFRRFQTLSQKLKNQGMDENLSDFYSAFSMGLNYSSKLRSSFFSELSKKGYNMVIDTEDSLLEAQAPIIVFDRKDTLKVLKTKELPKKYSQEWNETPDEGNLSEDKKWVDLLKKGDWSKP